MFFQPSLFVDNEAQYLPRVLANINALKNSVGCFKRGY